jgi:thioredoxin-related protein
MFRDLPGTLPGVSAPGNVFEPMMRTLVLACLLVAGSLCAAEPDKRDPREYFFTQTFGDLPEEMQVAREEGKLGMLLFFESENCSYCQLMLNKVLSDRRVQDWYRERFVNIAVDIHGDVELRDFDGITLPSKIFAEHRRIYLTPVVSFLDLDGREIYRHLGMVKTPGEFMILGEYIEGRHYFDTEYEVFAEQHGQDKREKILMTPAGESE